MIDDNTTNDDIAGIDDEETADQELVEEGAEATEVPSAEEAAINPDNESADEINNKNQ